MDVILKVLSEQWIFIILAALIVGATFVIKKQKTDIYPTYCKCALIATTVLLVVLALFFHLQDLFLLIPIVVLCCEMFGYEITGKIVAVLFVDFIVIILVNLLYDNGVINEVVDNILFFVLQAIVAVGIGFILDKHIRALQAKKKATANANPTADITDTNSDNQVTEDTNNESDDFSADSNSLDDKSTDNDDEEIDMDSLNEKIDSFLNGDM